MVKVIISSRANLQSEVDQAEKSKLKYAIISMTNPGDTCVPLRNISRNLIDRICLKFTDTVDEETKKKYGDRIIHPKQRWSWANPAQVDAIYNFILTNSRHVDVIICQCEAGISRSSAVATFIHYLHDEDNKAKKIMGSKTHYFPNPKILFDLTYKYLPKKIEKVKKDYDMFLVRRLKYK